MTRFMVHIGPHKTASSFIQQCLFDNVAVLRAGGIHLAHRWNDSPLKPSHSGLLERLNTERRGELQPIFDGWRHSGHETIVISSEDLAAMSLEPVKVQMLRELVGDSPTKIVFYVRRWSELLSSEWQEYVKQGSTLSYLEVLAHNLRNPVHSRIINIDTCLSVYARIFGLESIAVISYDEVVESGMNIFEHFAACCLGRPDLKATRPGMVNQSFPAAQIELIRLLNVLRQETGVPGQALVRFLEMRPLPPQLQAVLHALERFAGTIELSDDDPMIRAVRSLNRQQYAACAVPPVQQDAFYRNKRVEAHFIRPDYSLLVGFPDLVRTVWADLLADQAKADLTGV